VIGHLFQARFGSVAMDEERLMTAARHSVRARLPRTGGRLALIERRSHLAGRDDDLVSVAPLLDHCAGRFADPDLNRDGAVGRGAVGGSRAAATIGRPLGSASLTVSPPS